MQDPKLQEIATAHLLQEITDEEYRRLRTEYIDEITGDKEDLNEAAEQETSATDVELQADQADNTSHNIGIILFITVFATILVLFWVLTDL